MLRPASHCTFPTPFLFAVWTPLNVASREQENLEGFKAKDTPIGRIGQVRR